MSNNIFDKFDKQYDSEGIAKGITEIQENSGNSIGDFEPVPHGIYEVEIEKLEPAVSKKGDPKLYVQFKILAGDYENQRIFMHQPLTSEYPIHNASEFLRSLGTGMEIKYVRHSQFANLILDVHEAINGKYEYELEYGERKGYDTFKITKIFELEEAAN